MPRLLDLFCGAGGAAAGYARAGFDVVGVDNRPQPRYPYEFHQADALTYPLTGFDVVHASPPCQRYTRGNAYRDTTGYPDLIGNTRELLTASGLPYVIENVPDARPQLRTPMVLCGTMFGLTTHDDDGEPLQLYRHRLFESNVLLYPPGPCRHLPGVQVAGAYGAASTVGDTPAQRRAYARYGRRGGYVPAPHIRAALLGVDWPMPQAALNQAIPPAYAHHIGRQLLNHLNHREAPCGTASPST